MQQLDHLAAYKVFRLPQIQTMSRIITVIIQNSLHLNKNRGG